jgi:hypothetical protein
MVSDFHGHPLSSQGMMWKLSHTSHTNPHTW